MTRFTVHTSCLFDPKLKKRCQNVSITVDSITGLIVRIFERGDSPDPPDLLKEGDVDLRNKFVMPGLVDAHTHVFLHSYE